MKNKLTNLVVSLMIIANFITLALVIRLHNTQQAKVEELCEFYGYKK